MVTILYCMNFRGLPFHEAASLVGVTGEPTRSQGGQVPFAVFERVAIGVAQLRRHRRRSRFADQSRRRDAAAPISSPARSSAHNAFRAAARTADARPRLSCPRTIAAGAPPVVIIGYRVWTDRYGSDPSVDRPHRARSTARPATIIGVMPEGFTYPGRYAGLAAARIAPRHAAAPRPSARSASSAVWPTASHREQAQAELAAIVSTLTTVPNADRARRTDRHAAQRDLFRQAPRNRCR